MNQTKSASRFSFYNYDHLGNTRVTYASKCDNGNITLTTQTALDYYPYGKELRAYNSGGEKYKSTTNERDLETGYDHREARNSNANDVRFLTIDPMASKFPSLSPYCYVSGNPLLSVDRDGRDTTIYLRFVTTGNYFNDEQARSDLILNMYAILWGNGLTNVKIVTTTKTFEQMQGQLDITDQYLEITNGGKFSDYDDPNTPYFKYMQASEQGMTAGYHSVVNLGANRPGSGFVMTDGYYSIRGVANTAIHEILHGYLSRSTWENATPLADNAFAPMSRLGFDANGHYNNKPNIMMDGSTRFSQPLRNAIPEGNMLTNAAPMTATEFLLKEHQKVVKSWLDKRK